MPDLALSLESFHLAETVITGEDKYRLNSTFGFVRSFAELCSVIETLVLCDHVYMFIDSQNAPYNTSLFGRALQDAGIMRDAYELDWRISPFAFPVKDFQKDERKAFFENVTSKVFSPIERSSVDIEYAKILLEGDVRVEASVSGPGLIYKPLTWRLHVDVKYEDEITMLDSSLLRAYNSVVSRGHSILLQRLRFGYPFPFLIPPIMSTILYRTAKPEAIVSNTLELREEFSETRSKFKDLDKAFRNETVSIEEFEEGQGDSRQRRQDAKETALYHKTFL
jgi:hypothetical protein